MHLATFLPLLAFLGLRNRYWIIIIIVVIILIVLAFFARGRSAP